MSRLRWAVLAFSLLEGCRSRGETRGEPCTDAIVTISIPSDWGSWPVVADGHVATRDDGRGPHGEQASMAEVSLQNFVVRQRLFEAGESSPYLEISARGCTGDSVQADTGPLPGGHLQRFMLGRSHYDLSLRNRGERYVVTATEVDPTKAKDDARFPIAAFRVKAP
jgi:hypothetical protein